MARPRKAEPRNQQINLRFSAPELVRVHAHAALIGKTVNEFGRSVLLRRPRRRKGGAPPAVIAWSDATLAKWHALGTRLNDIAHLMNARRPAARRAAAAARALAHAVQERFCDGARRRSGADLRSGAAGAASPPKGGCQSRANREALRSVGTGDTACSRAPARAHPHPHEWRSASRCCPRYIRTACSF